MNNKLEVIGIDHGWSMMKTVTQVFVTGVKEITTTPALFGDVLEYDGKYYKIGTVRQEVKDTKVEDDSFYLLTLAAVAKELKKRGLSDAKVFLAVGLPLTRFGAERNNFIKYLTKNKRVDFRYENEASDFAIIKESFEVKRAEAEKAIDRLQKEAENIAAGIERDTEWLEEHRKWKTMPSLTRNVVVSLIQSVKVYEGGDIEIVLDCDDEYRKIVARAGELERQYDAERLVV